eukprot:7391388-Prymnesium_polylepis.3
MNDVLASRCFSVISVVSSRVWVPDLGLALRARPGTTCSMTWRSGAEAPWHSRKTLPLARVTAVTTAGSTPPRLVGIALRAILRAKRQAVLNPGRNTSFCRRVSGERVRAGAGGCSFAAFVVGGRRSHTCESATRPRCKPAWPPGPPASPSSRTARCMPMPSASARTSVERSCRSSRRPQTTR